MTIIKQMSFNFAVTSQDKNILIKNILIQVDCAKKYFTFADCPKLMKMQVMQPTYECDLIGFHFMKCDQYFQAKI